MTESTTTLNVVALPGGMKQITVTSGATVADALAAASDALGAPVSAASEFRLNGEEVSPDSPVESGGTLTATEKVAGATVFSAVIVVK